MLIRRFYDDRLAQASYMIACQKTGEAIVIDPARDITPYVAAAKEEGVRITRVTETHIHADFLSGTRELAARTGGTVLLSGEGGADWQYGYAKTDNATLLHDGDVISLGNVRLEVWHTPGHTPEHLSFIVIDGARSDEPVAMVTGDFVFVGDVGRPDLLEVAAGVKGTMESGARQLFHSLARLGSLPDHLQIWPGHGAGSACGKALGSMPTSTLGYERRTNWAFSITDEAAFVAAVLEGQPAPPTYFAIMKRVNRDGPVVLGERGPITALTPADLAVAMRDGMVLDVRPRVEYGQAHIPGTLNIPLAKAFTKWAGWLLPYDRDLYVIAKDNAGALEARRALASIGLDRVHGAFGQDLIDAARASGTARQSALGDINESEAMLAAGRHIIDLREAHEWHDGHITGAEHHPLGKVPSSLASLDRSTPIGVHCQGGGRSAIGASLLESMGFTDVIDLSNGYGARDSRDEKRETRNGTEQG